MGSERKQTLRMVNGEKRRGLQLERQWDTYTRDAILHLEKAKGGKDLEDLRGEGREIMEEYHHAWQTWLRSLHSEGICLTLTSTQNPWVIEDFMYSITVGSANSPVRHPEVTLWLPNKLNQMHHITVWMVQMQHITLTRYLFEEALRLTSVLNLRYKEQFAHQFHHP